VVCDVQDAVKGDTSMTVTSSEAGKIQVRSDDGF
jgi:hypothetical protein